MRFILLTISLFMLGACVQDEGKIPSTSATTTTGGSNNGNDDVVEVVVPGSDPLVQYAWHLKNTGAEKAFSLSDGDAGFDMNVENVHDDGDGILGAGVRIAVSDTGLVVDHEDLVSNMLTGEHRNYGHLDSTRWRAVNADPYPSGDATGAVTAAHGTAVSGLIAALGWNGLGSRGIAPAASVAGFKYIISYPPLSITLPYDAEEQLIYDRYVASALAKNIDQMDGNFDIFNYSYGYPSCRFIEEDEDALDALAAGVTGPLALRSGKGALYVQSSGNSYIAQSSSAICGADPQDSNTWFNHYGNTNTKSDLTTPHKIIVSAYNAEGVVSSYSTPGSSIWVSAPGGEDGFDKPAMITTDIPGCSSGLSFSSFIYRYSNPFNFGYNTVLGDSENAACDYTSIMNGTSSAAPMVTGLVALMLEANPSLTWRDVKHILAVSANINSSSEIAIGLGAALPHPDGLNYGAYVYDVEWTNNGFFDYSNNYGFGRVDAELALTLADPVFYTPLTAEATPLVNSTAGPIVIPDDITTPATSAAIVVSSITVETVQVKINLDHPKAGQLGVNLVSPNGTRSRLLLINSRMADDAFTGVELTLLTNAFYGTSSNGSWTLEVVDGELGDSGQINSWELIINGRN